MAERKQRLRELLKSSELTRPHRMNNRGHMRQEWKLRTGLTLVGVC